MTFLFSDIHVESLGLSGPWIIQVWAALFFASCESSKVGATNRNWMDTNLTMGER